MTARPIRALLCAGVAVLALAPGVSADTTVRQGTAMRLETSRRIAAPPSRVWATITTGRNLVTWCPAWSSEANRSVALTRVGDSLEFVDEWGNGGRSVVTYLVPDRELRVAHEPNDGSYMCRARLILEPVGEGTLVTLVEQYTDDGEEADRRATAETTQAGMESTLAALGRVAEVGK
jgi:uncharacterized protein YndB with AHSA1/START domain